MSSLIFTQSSKKLAKTLCSPLRQQFRFRFFTSIEIKEAPKLKLHSYWRSSCSQRVRIALNLKGLEYEYKAVNLLKGEQFAPEFEKLNPLKYVPVLEDGNVVVADSFAILLYLEDKYPEHPLLPRDLQKKALNIQVNWHSPEFADAINQAASAVTSSIQPLQNLAVLNYIEEKISSDEKLVWVQRHLNNGFAALEKLLKSSAGRYAIGDDVGLADVFLAPQIGAGITRFQIDMSPYPTLARLHGVYTEHSAFQAAHPDKQPDAPSSS